jgi:deoxyxylulose-5-phosphate synthase
LLLTRIPIWFLSFVSFDKTVRQDAIFGKSIDKGGIVGRGSFSHDAAYDIKWLKNSEERVLIIPRKDFETIRQKTGAIGLTEIASKKGINYSKERELEVIAVVSKKQSTQ